MLGLHFCSQTFSSWSEQRPILVAVQGPTCVGFCCCGAQALGNGLQSLQYMGSVAATHGLRCSMVCGIFWIRDRTCIPYTGRWIPIHCTTREVLDLPFDLYCCVWTLNFPIQRDFGFPVAFHTLSSLWVVSLQLFAHCQHYTLIRFDSSWHTSNNSFEMVFPL